MPRARFSGKIDHVSDRQKLRTAAVRWLAIRGGASEVVACVLSEPRAHNLSEYLQQVNGFIKSVQIDAD